MKPTLPLMIYLPNGFADWEGAFLTAEWRQTGCTLLYVTEDGKPVTSIGGLKAQPDRALDEVKPSDICGLVLIGSDDWPDATKNKSVLAFAKQVHAAAKPVAAICAATVALARTGLMDTHKHTSNSLGSLKEMVPDYKGEKSYQDLNAVCDGNIITAPGVAPLDFAVEVLRHFHIFSEEYLKCWYDMNKNQTAPPKEFWQELMRVMEAES